MNQPTFLEIIKDKIAYYGQTEAAYDFAVQEYIRQTFTTLENVFVEGKPCKYILMPKNESTDV